MEASAIYAEIMESGAAVWLADSFRASASLSFDDKVPDLVDVIAEELEEPSTATWQEKYGYKQGDYFFIIWNSNYDHRYLLNLGL